MKRFFILLLFSVILFGGVYAQQYDFAIYTGSGTWNPSIVAFENFLDWKGLTWREVDKNIINTEDLRLNYKGIFMPGGWAGDYNRDIKPSGDQNIRDLISSGGHYIGMSAGAFYACDITIWEGRSYDYPSDMFNGDCIGPIPEIAPWPNYVMTTMDINKDHPANIYSPLQKDVLYYGEPYFVPHSGQEMQTFASWIVPSNSHVNGKPGIIGFNYGQGRILLVGPHPEIEEDSSRDGPHNFAEELSDGPDGSDWPFLWTAVDWIMKRPISMPPGYSITQCSDGIDNDGDNSIDFPNDFGCSSSEDNSEINDGLTQCSDGIDNDGDNLIDQNDLGCTNYLDDNETNPSGPQQIFYDNFESGNLNSWTTSSVSGGLNWENSATDPFQGSKHAQSQPRSTSEPASILEKTISTTGFNTVLFSYYRKLIGLDSADEFKVKWFDGTSWNIVEQTGSSSANDVSYQYKQFSLPSTASNNPNFKIRFECTAGAVSEYCRIDNVNLTGQ